MILFPDGIQGLSDSKWAGARGSAHRLVGIDYRSEPGAIKAHQKLSKISASTVDELCKVSLPLSDGSTLWFSSESGKIWREVDDVFTLESTMEIPGYTFGLQSAEYSSFYNFSTQVNIPISFVFKPDGLSMFVLCNSKISGDQEVYQYTLSSAFDVSTASYASKTFTPDINAGAMAMSSDGTKVFIAEDGGSTTIITYTLGTAWDLATAGVAGDTFDFSAQFSRSISLNFNDTGTIMAVFDQTSESIYKYDLGTAWDITTAVFSESFVIDTGLANRGGCFAPDGSRIFVQQSSNNARISEYVLSTAWDLTTASLTTTTFEPDGERYFGISAAPDSSGFYVGTQSSESVYRYELTPADEDLSVTILGAEEFGVPDGLDGPDEDNDNDEMTQYVYFATENWLLRISLSNITDWTKFEYLTLFKYGDDTYHPVKKANGRLYFGDKHTICEVNEAGVITLESDFSVREPECITLLENFDVDLLITTKNVDGKSKILRWDTESPTWYGEDFMYEDEVHAFLDEDNYTYAIVGDYGQMHYYDGEKLLKHIRIPGTYGSTQRCKVNANAVGYFMGIPIFGLTNIEGNPALQGVYSYGQYSKDYDITMDLSFPVSSGELEGLEIGSIVVQGTDVYVSWKSATAVGIDKLDWTTKYFGAYIESMVLNNAEDRSKFKALDNVLADYIEIPENTSIEMAYSKNYETYEVMAQQDNDKLLQLRAKETVPEIGAITVKFTFKTNANDTPKIENFHANFEGED